MKLGWTLLGLIGILCVRIAFAKTTTFYYGDAFLTIALGLALLEGALALGLLATRPALRHRAGAANRVTRARAVFLVLTVGLLAPAILLLWLNQALDASPGRPQAPVMGGKWTETRRGWTTCYAAVTADVRRSPLLLPSPFGDAEAIAVPCAGYDALQPGRSTVTLTVHSGAFGLPWYERVGPGL